jgi:iron complex transport system ATP-binding protein
VTDPAGDPPLQLEHIVFEREGRRILDDLSLTVTGDQHWVVLGANGSGKTTLLRIGAMYEHPSSGTVRVLGEELGRTDVRTLRRRVGYASAALAGQFRTALTAIEIVMTAKYAALEPWWHQYTDDDRRRARDCLDRMGVGGFAERTLGTLSSGEQQRVFIARTLMNDPGVILLDEPSARLDLGGREQLVAALAELASHEQGSPFVFVTHHVDEIPVGISHALLLKDGRVVTQGPLDEALTSESLSDCFSMPLALERRGDGRLTAWARA